MLDFFTDHYHLSIIGSLVGVVALSCVWGSIALKYDLRGAPGFIVAFLLGLAFVIIVDNHLNQRADNLVASYRQAMEDRKRDAQFETFPILYISKDNRDTLTVYIEGAKESHISGISSVKSSDTDFSYIKTKWVDVPEWEGASSSVIKQAKFRSDFRSGYYETTLYLANPQPVW